MQHKFTSLGYIAGWLSVIINIILFVFKYWVGIKFASVAMRADAWHTLSDTLTSLVVIAGFWISMRPADKKHPFGHGRAEAICAVIIGILLAIVGFNFLIEATGRLQNTRSAQFGEMAIIVFFFSVIIKEGLAQFSFWVGKKINSRALAADGWHHRSDAIASGLIVIGALVSSYFWWIDGVMGIGVSLLILYAAFSIVREVADLLLGEEPDSALEDKIKDMIKNIAPSAYNVHHLHIHRYGDHIELTLHIMLPSTFNLGEAHDIAIAVEKAMKEQMNIEATIHIDPLDENEGIT